MKIFNKSVGYNYQLFDRIEAGIELSGSEVKSLFGGHATLDQAYVKFVGNELFLLNAHIHPYPYADVRKIDPKRTRKLLLHKKELVSLQSKTKQKNLILVPLVWYSKGRQIKLEIALARGKKMWEKKESIRKADIAREIEEDFKLKIKN